MGRFPEPFLISAGEPRGATKKARDPRVVHRDRHKTRPLVMMLGGAPVKKCIGDSPERDEKWGERGQRQRRKGVAEDRGESPAFLIRSKAHYDLRAGPREPSISINTDGEYHYPSVAVAHFEYERSRDIMLIEPGDITI